MRLHYALCFPLALAGCFTELNGVKDRHDLAGQIDEDLAIGPNDDGAVPSGDLKGADLAKTDAGSSSCELPYVAVLINADNTSSHGRVERIPVDGRPKCTPLTLGKTLPPDLTAMGFLPPNTIALGGTNIVYQVTLDDKAAAGIFVGDSSYAYGVPVDDLFGIKDQDDNWVLGVTYDAEQFTSTGNEIAYLAIVDGDQHVVHWQLASSSGQIRVSSDVRAVTTSAIDAHKIMLAKGLTDPIFAAAEIGLPWNGDPVEVKAPYYQQGLGSPGEARSIRTLRYTDTNGTWARTAWSFRPNGAAYQVYMRNDHGAGSNAIGPLTCSLPNCSTETNDPIFDAVPDPTNLNAVIAICVDPQTSSSHVVSHVVRMTAAGDCELIFDGSKLLTGEYPSKLTNVYPEP